MNPGESFFWPRVAVVTGVILAAVFACAKARGAPPRKEIARPLNVEALLEAIADVESGNDPTATGKRGELGRCQFMPTTWVHYTNAPFRVYAPQDCELTRKIEKAHLGRICATLLQRGHPLDPALIAAAWRFGVDHAAAHVREDSSRFVANLYFAQPDRKAKPLPTPAYRFKIQ